MALMTLGIIGALVTPGHAGRKHVGEHPGGGGGGSSHEIKCTIKGTAGNDYVRGTMGADIICPGRGNDRVAALGGDDTILAGHDDDVAHGGGGVDRIDGQQGRDVLYGGDGPDWIQGGKWSDVLVGNGGDDHLRDITVGTDECFDGDRVGVGYDC